ncbi:hypothetical protein [Paenibacillus sp. 22594]|uniref:hypothetical protein n=1 Tax=Paenibacillus sp. 22594 TaxID=3453947 RepID=UPI003F83799C
MAKLVPNNGRNAVVERASAGKGGNNGKSAVVGAGMAELVPNNGRNAVVERASAGKGGNNGKSAVVSKKSCPFAVIHAAGQLSAFLRFVLTVTCSYRLDEEL